MSRTSLQGDTIEQAFEVEDLNSRENYIFKYIPNEQVLLLNSSRGMGNKVMSSFPEQHDTYIESKTKFPFGCNTAYEYFVCMYKKSLKFTEGLNSICFLGWVDIYTYEPIELEFGE